MTKFRALHPWGKALVIVLAVAIPAAASFTALSRYKTFTREPLISADLNAWQDATNTGINNIGVFVPGGATGDSIDIKNAAHDTLTAKDIAKIVLKDPLVSLSASDSLLMHLINIRRVNGDTLWLGAPNVALVFSGGGTAGKRWRFNLADMDSVRIRDSLTVLPGAKVTIGATVRVVFADGSSADIPRAQIDSLYLAGTRLTVTAATLNDADLATYAGITPSTNVQTMLGSANNAAIRSNIGNYSALDASDGSPNPALSMDAAGNPVVHSTGEILTGAASAGSSMRENLYDNTAAALPLSYIFQDNASATAPLESRRMDAHSVPIRQVQSALALGGTVQPLNTYAGNVNITDDATATILSGLGLNASVMYLSYGGGSGAYNNGMAIISFINVDATSNAFIVVQGGNWTIALTTADVTGTTGTDGNITVSIRSGIVEVENRAGGTLGLRWDIRN